MPKFDFLPQKEKEKLELEKLKVSLFSFFRLFSLAVIFFVGILFSICLYLEIATSSQKNLIEVKRKSKEFLEIKEIEKEIDNINQKIKEIFSLQEKSIYLPPFLEEIIKILPQKDVSLSQLSISIEKEKITISPPPSESEEEKKEKKEEPKAPKIIEKEFLKGEINGFAKTREKVLEIEKALKENSIFYDVEAPIENLLSPKDINFRFSFKIKYE